MQSPGLVTESQAAVQSVNWLLEDAWNGSDYVDESDRLMSATVRHELRPILDVFWGGGISANEMTVTLDNVDQRYNNLNTASGSVRNAVAAFATNNGRGTPVRFSAGYSGTNLRQFTGFVDDLELSADMSVAQIRCSDIVEAMAGRRASTTLYRDIRSTAYLAHVLAAVSDSPTPSLTADVGSAVLHYAWMAGETQHEEIRRILEAEGGWFFAGKSGGVNFWNQWHFLLATFATTSQATIQQADLLELPQRRNGDPEHVFDAVELVWELREAAPLQVVYDGGQGITIGPGDTIEVLIEYDEPVVEPQALTADDWVAVTAGRQRKGSYHVSTNPTGVQIVRSEQRAQSALLTITNHDPKHTVTFQRLQQRGFPVQVTGSHKAIAAGSGQGRTERLDGLVYIGDPLSAAGTASRRQQVRRSAPVLVRFASVCYPALELGDRITVPVASGVSSGVTTFTTEQYWVTSIEQTLGPGGYLMEIEAIRADNPYDCDAPPVLGTHSYGTSRQVA